MFKDADGEMIVRGKNIGPNLCPNLYGVIGRVAGSEDFNMEAGSRTRGKPASSGPKRLSPSMWLTLGNG